MKRELHWYDALSISSAYLGTTTLIQSMTPLVLPLLVQRFVGETRKGAGFGTIRLWALMAALLIQALMGMLSDRCTLRWGRRRPFILIGMLTNLISLAAIAWTATLEGMTGYWAIFFFYLLFQITVNTVLGPLHGLIPDLVPETKRGIFSAVKSLFEVSIPIILISFIITPRIGVGDIGGGLLIGAVILVATTIPTLLVQEERLTAAPPINWQPFLRLLLMTAAFTAIILTIGAGVGVVGRGLRDSTPSTVLLGMGLAGLIAMLIAVAAGVWVSVHISLGRSTEDKDVTRQRAFIWWVVNRLAFFVGINNIAGFAVYFIQGRLGIPNEQAAEPAGRLMLVVGIFILLSALPSGWLTDRFGRKRMVAISGIIAVVGTTIVLATRSIPVIYIGGCCIGIATGLFYTSNWALGTDLIPLNEAGRYLGLANLAGAGAGAVGAYIGGPVADYFTAQLPQLPGIGYVVLFVIYDLLFGFSVIALVGIKPRDAAVSDLTAPS
jgi:Na+/melibiose symporter-like transporter